MTSSDRLNAIPPYPFVEMEKSISEKKKEGVDIISFGIGDPDISPPSFVNEALIDGLELPGSHNYSSSEGELFFRETISEWFKHRFNVDVDPKTEICAVIGSKEGLGNLQRGLLNPGDKVVCPNPCYPLYQHAGTILNDAVPVEITLEKENQFKPDLDNLQSTDFTNIFLNYPNNPTGAVVDKNYLIELVDICRNKKSQIIYDNAYSEVTFNDYKAPSILEADPDLECSIEFHSLSKTFNMTVYRIGFAVGNSELISTLKKVKSQIDSGSPIFVQHAASEALKKYHNGNPPNEILKNLELYSKRMSLIAEGFKEFGFEVDIPLGTFYLWVEVGNDSKTITDKLLEQGIVVTPGAGFGTNGKNFIRLAATVNEDRINEAIDRLKYRRFNF